MNLLSVFGLIWLTVLAILSLHLLDRPLLIEWSANTKKPHPFLLGQKIRISEARVIDLAYLPGISHQKARVLHQFLHEGAEKKIDDLAVIKGMGPKTMARMREHFY